MLDELKVKIKSLAAEAVIIRQQEQKTSGQQRNSLHNHRVIDVRSEARAALLAYAYLRFKPLVTVERPGSRPADWKNVRRIARKFGGDRYDEVAFAIWQNVGV